MTPAAAAAPEGGSTNDCSQRLRELVANDELAIPPFPEVAQRVIEIASDDTSPIEAMARLVHRDASLASTLLRSANSAALGGAVKIVSVGQAIGRLGMRHVAEIALATSLRGGVFSTKSYSLIGGRIWRRSLATALFAKEVAREVRKNVEVAFLCGLLWRVGQPLVLHALSQLDSGDALDTLEVDALIAELDRDFTAHAAETWQLPEVVAVAIATDPSANGSGSETLIAVLAEHLTDLALGDSSDASSLVGSPETERLNLYPERIEALYASAESVLREVDEAP